MQGITQGIEDLRSIFCEETDRVRQARIDELSLHQERNPKILSQLLTQDSGITEQSKFLVGRTWEFYDPESGSSSGATHVPDQASTILSPRTMPRRDSGLPHDTQNIMDTWRNVFSLRPPVHEWLSSTIFHNSKNLTSSPFRNWNPDTAEATRKREDEMKRESLNTSILSLHFQSRSDMLNHTDGTFFSQTYDWLSENFCPGIESWEISWLYGISKLENQLQELRFVPEQTILWSSMHWIKEVQITKSIDELVISRSIEERSDVPDFDMLDTMITSALKKLLNTQIHFRKRVSVEGQRAQKSDRFLGGRRITHMIHEHFRAIRNLWSSTRTLRLVNFEFKEWRRPSFRRSMGSCTIISEWNASDMIPEGLYKSKLQDSVQLRGCVERCMNKKLLETKESRIIHKLKRAVKLHIDQMMMNSKTSGFGNNVVERGSVKKGKKTFVERKVRECF